MEFGLMPTFASLAFLIILMLVYFSKENLNNTSNKIYKMYIISVFLFSVIQIAYVFVLKNVDIKWIYYVLWRLYWLLGAFGWGVLSLYLIVLINNIKVDSFKELIKYNRQLKILSAIFIIIPVLCLVIPPTDLLDKFTPDEITYNPGIIYIIEIAYIGLISLIMFIYLLKNKTKVSKLCKTTVIVFLSVTVVDFTLQITFPHISFLNTTSVVMAFVLYFNYTNPDIEIMNEISSAKVDIEKSSKTKTDFLSNMTYEIKTPLNLISTLCESLENMGDFDPEEAKKELTQITVSGNNLLDIVDNVLDISKIETGKSVLMEKEYRIKDILDDSLDAAKSKIGAKPVKLVANIDQNISSVLYGDSSKLYQAVLNIITNASKYTEVGKVTFTITSTKNDEEETLLFKVSDTGPGIKEEDQAKLFSKGTRLDNSKEGEIEGSGFGLNISKEYIDSLGGKIWFNSEYRVGSTFYIEVTQKVADKTTIGEMAQKESSKNKNEKVDCSNCIALIVDDNKPNVKVVKRLLEKYKFKVESVPSGQECIYKVKSEVKYDIIFLDHIMPDMDGIETLKVLKGLAGYKLPPIVALTANAISGMKETYLNAGFDEYLSKPINIVELDRVINKFFKK